MDYQKFASIEDAVSKMPFRILVPTEVNGLPRAAVIRWIDRDNDMFFQTYIGYSPDPRGEPGPYYPTSKVLFVQGHGVRCNLETGAAPVTQKGVVVLPDGRQAVWAFGVPENKWDKTRPAWIAWLGRDGVIRRLEGYDVQMAVVRRIAADLSALE